MRIAIALGIVLLLAACSPATPVQDDTTETTVTCPDGTIVNDMTECPSEQMEEEEPVVDPTETPQEQVDGDEQKSLTGELYGGDHQDGPKTGELYGSQGSRTASVDPEVDSMRDRADEKAGNGYTFTYQQTVNGQALGAPFSGMKVYIKDNQVAYSWGKEVVLNDIKIDRAVLQEDSLIVWCESCGDEPVRRIISENPLEKPPALYWLNMIEDGEVTGSQTVNNRQANRVVGTVNDANVVLFVDTFSGIPVRIESGDTIYEYRDVVLSVPADIFDTP